MDELLTVARKIVIQEPADATSGQDGSVVVIEDRVASSSEAAAGALPADERSEQVMGDVGRQQSTGGADDRQKREEEVAEVVPGLGAPVIPLAADVATVTVPDQVGHDGLAKAEEIIENLKAGSLVLHGGLIAEKSAHACALLDNSRVQRDKKRALKWKEEVARLLTFGQAKQENCAVVEQLEKDVLTVTIKTGNRLVL